MNTTNTDLRIPSEEDAAAANTVTLVWLRQPSIQLEKKFHTERLCRSAVAGGFIRESIGFQPTEILIRYHTYLCF